MLGGVPSFSHMTSAPPEVQQTPGTLMNHPDITARPDPMRQLPASFHANAKLLDDVNGPGTPACTVGEATSRSDCVAVGDNERASIDALGVSTSATKLLAGEAN
jgi:hypothetical protein